jgi:hypothetical protein
MEKLIDMNAKRTGRLQIGAISEFYEDLLRVDAFLANNSLAAQGKSLLQSYLGQKESKIKERVAYLARKRNISTEELWQQIQAGTAQQMTKEEYADLAENQQDGE